MLQISLASLSGLRPPLAVLGIIDFIARSIRGFMDPYEVILTLDTKSDIELSSSVNVNCFVSLVDITSDGSI